MVLHQSIQCYHVNQAPDILEQFGDIFVSKEETKPIGKEKSRNHFCETDFVNSHRMIELIISKKE